MVLILDLLEIIIEFELVIEFVLHLTFIGLPSSDAILINLQKYKYITGY